jgi:hypothetical protein
VVAVRYHDTSKTLIGTTEVQDELAEAMDKGYSPDVSIGAKQRAVDGKMYLHHVAYLGEEPPAIKDLVNKIQVSLNPAATPLAASDAQGVIQLPSLSANPLVLSDSSAGAGATYPQGGGSMTWEQVLGELEEERTLTVW